MEETDPDPPEFEHSMDVDHSDNNVDVDVHPLALVAVNVDVDEIVGREPIQSVTFQIVIDEDGDGHRTSSEESEPTSSHPSPVMLDEGSRESLELANVAAEDTSVPSKKRSFNQSELTEDDGALCPICLDSWTSTGPHRICSLRCGHLFGYKCVDRWLNSQTKKTCPTCKKRVRRSDIRYIYVNKLMAIDNRELENIQRQLDVALREKCEMEADLKRRVTREFVMNQEIDSLKREIRNLTRSSAVMGAGSSSSDAYKPETVKLYMDKSMEICKYGQSRVFDANCAIDLLVASMKSPTNLFNGFGLKKMNISNYKPLAFIPVHNLQIRDICFHPENNWILTASMDKTFKVIDNTTNLITHQFVHNIPLWSCCWDLNNQYIMYVGTQSGSLLKYDLRRLTEPVAYLTIERDMSPVVSIASVPALPGEPLPHGGVICCKLNSLWIFEDIDHMQLKHSLSLEGPFVSMKYQTDTRQMLVSSRPNSRTTYSRHTLCTLSRDDQNKVDCNIVHCFQGGGMQKLLSKSCFLSNNSDYVAAHQEDTRSVLLWNINTGRKVSSVPSHETVLDLKGLQNNQGNYLVSLSETKLKFFKFA